MSCAASYRDATGMRATRGAALIVTAVDGIESQAAEIAERLRITVEIASTRAAALRLLGRRSYTVIVIDQILMDSDPEGFEPVWNHAGFAIPLQINFALAGRTRLEREMRGAMGRRDREQQLALAAAAAALDDDLKNAITGFLLESRLALREEEVPTAVRNRLEKIAAMADHLRVRFLPTGAAGTTSVALPDP
jgi:hypothetical protein